MPAFIKMILSNGNPSQQHVSAVIAENKKKSSAANIPRALNSSMISRIHNVKPGCGGCGKH